MRHSCADVAKANWIEESRVQRKILGEKYRNDTSFYIVLGGHKVDEFIKIGNPSRGETKGINFRVLQQ